MGVDGVIQATKAETIYCLYWIPYIFEAPKQYP